ncbi:Branched-chain amino acid transport system / permease component [Xylophilus ampelinus]|nr:Branched-chain amino acid transport system / permease component [Xylophilus ampelinus]
MDYLIHILSMAGIFAILALSLDLLVGLGGMMSLATGVFFGIGAYSTALLVKAGWPMAAAMLAGMGLATLLSLFVALPAIRIRGVYLLIVTIAVQMVFTTVAQNWRSVTGGDAGVSNIPPIAIFELKLRGVAFLALVLGSCAALWWLLRRIAGSPFGRVLRAIRDDEAGATSLGKHATATKLATFGLSACVAAYAGSLYAHYTSYIDPHSFNISLSILVLLMVMLGGAGTLLGPMLGALVLILLPEALKFLPLPHGIAPALRQFSYGALLVAVVFLRPQGLLGKAPPSRPSH